MKQSNRVRNQLEKDAKLARIMGNCLIGFFLIGGVTIVSMLTYFTISA